MILGMITVTYAKTGDILGYAKYTDISAYINHYPITSYNINDYTAVVAEDLRNYGFNVVWDGENRDLFITRNFDATQIIPYGTVYKYSAKAGKNSFPYLETDINTYVNGNKVESFNIDGKTCLYIDALAPYGEVAWVPEIRAIKLWIKNLPIKDYAPIEEFPMAQTITGEYEHLRYDNSVTISEYDGTNIGFEIISIGQNGNRIATAFIRDTISDGVCYFNFMDSWGNTGNGILKILDNGNLSLSFYDVEFIGLWGVSIGEGEYRRTRDVLAVYEPIEEAPTIEGSYRGGGTLIPGSIYKIGQWNAHISNATSNSINLSFGQGESDYYIDDMLLYKQENGSYYGVGYSTWGESYITIWIESSDCISLTVSGNADQTGTEYLYKE